MDVANNPLSKNLADIFGDKFNDSFKKSFHKIKDKIHAKYPAFKFENPMSVRNWIIRKEDNPTLPLRSPSLKFLLILSDSLSIPLWKLFTDKSIKDSISTDCLEIQKNIINNLFDIHDIGVLLKIQKYVQTQITLADLEKNAIPSKVDKFQFK